MKSEGKKTKKQEYFTGTIVIATLTSQRNVSGLYPGAELSTVKFLKHEGTRHSIPEANNGGVYLEFNTRLLSMAVISFSRAL